jgi:hypothetical protein
VSSLWTPYGEHQPEPEPPAAGEPNAPGGPPGGGGLGRGPGGGDAFGPGGPGDLGREPTEEELIAMQQQLLQTPVADIVANNLVQLYEIAVLHLSYARAALDAVTAGEPSAGDGRGAAAHAHHSAEATIAIDAFGAVLDTLGERLGEASQQLRDILIQLRLAYVQIAGSPSTSGIVPPA